MPACRICKQRIDLSKTGVRAHKCKECGKLVCRNHFDFAREICYNCADIPAVKGKIPFSFIRKTQAPDKPGKG